MASFRDKRAFISGSTAGIGLGIARTFMADGCRVAINGRESERIGKIVTQTGGLPIVADLSEPDACVAAASRLHEVWGGLDILVCNVGSGRSVPPGEETAAEWERMLGLNLLTTTNLVRACEPLFPAEGGAIVCISSICGVETLGAPVAYSAAKAALNAYVSGIARPLARKNIRINAVAPGNILFPGGTWERKLGEDRTAVEAMLEREVPMRRFGTVEEVAAVVSFLASPAASFITGTVLVVDGGQCRSHS